MNSKDQDQLTHLLEILSKETYKNFRDSQTLYKKWQKVKDDPRILDHQSHPLYPFKTPYNMFYYQKLGNALTVINQHLKFYPSDD